MSERDKLIDILSVPIYPANGVDYTEVVADYLLDNNVTIPPVTVGQTIYLIRKPIDRPAWIDECAVTHVQVNYSSDGKVIVFSTYNFAATESEIGETVFLTREEAEKVLEAKS